MDQQGIKQAFDEGGGRGAWEEMQSSNNMAQRAANDMLMDPLNAVSFGAGGVVGKAGRSLANLDDAGLITRGAGKAIDVTAQSPGIVWDNKFKATRFVYDKVMTGAKKMPGASSLISPIERRLQSTASRAFAKSEKTMFKVKGHEIHDAYQTLSVRSKQVDDPSKRVEWVEKGRNQGGLPGLGDIESGAERNRKGVESIINLLDADETPVGPLDQYESYRPRYEAMMKANKKVPESASLIDGVLTWGEGSKRSRYVYLGPDRRVRIKKSGDAGDWSPNFQTKDGSKYTMTPGGKTTMQQGDTLLPASDQTVFVASKDVPRLVGSLGSGESKIGFTTDGRIGVHRRGVFDPNTVIDPIMTPDKGLVPLEMRGGKPLFGDVITKNNTAGRPRYAMEYRPTEGDKKWTSVDFADDVEGVSLAARAQLEGLELRRSTLEPMIDPGKKPTKRQVATEERARFEDRAMIRGQRKAQALLSDDEYASLYNEGFTNGKYKDISYGDTLAIIEADVDVMRSRLMAEGAGWTPKASFEDIQKQIADPDLAKMVKEYAFPGIDPLYDSVEHVSFAKFNKERALETGIEFSNESVWGLAAGTWKQQALLSPRYQTANYVSGVLHSIISGHASAYERSFRDLGRNLQEHGLTATKNQRKNLEDGITTLRLDDTLSAYGLRRPEVATSSGFHIQSGYDPVTGRRTSYAERLGKKLHIDRVGRVLGSASDKNLRFSEGQDATFRTGLWEDVFESGFQTEATGNRGRGHECLPAGGC